MAHIYGALSFFKYSFVKIFSSIELYGEKNLSFLRFFTIQFGFFLRKQYPK